MSYRELTMIEIKEVLRRWAAEQSLHQIARETSLDRKTVRRYVQAAESLALARGAELDDARDIVDPEACHRADLARQNGHRSNNLRAVVVVESAFIVLPQVT